LEEIEALPFVQGREEAYAIAQRLLKEFQPPYRIEIDSGFDGSECRLRLSSVSKGEVSSNAALVTRV
jgi:hypothetical protein